MLTKRRMITPALAAMLLLALPPVAHAEANDDDYGDEYSDGAYARVQAIDGGLTIRRAVDVEDAAAADDVYVNSPVFPGDTVLTSTAQRAEVQLAGGSLIRIDDRSELTFLALPNPYAEFADNGVLQLAAGAMQLTIALPDDGELRVDTPAATVYFLEDGDFRVEVSPNGATYVSARRGVAEVVGEGGSVLVRGGTRTEVVAGSLPADPYPFNTFASDAFDRWVERREEVYAPSERFEAETYSELPTEVRPYYRELNSHGDWAHVDDYGYVWRPTGVSSSWRPYYDGYWDYGPRGYFWVSHEPWGWAPYHYGRWNYLPRYGWCWVPGRVFAGAWVAWSWGSAHVGWAPLDFWGRPAYINTVHYGYYDPHCWTFVNYTNLHRRHYSRYAVRVDQVGVAVRTATVVRRAPRVPPSRLARSAESRERAVSLAGERAASRIRPTDRDVRPTRSMRDAESRLAATARGAARREAISGVSASGRSDTRTFPRRISAQDGRATALRDSGRSRPAARTEGGDGAATDRRVRDLYRRMASPSTTQERPVRPATPAPAAGDRRETPQRATPPRGSTAERATTPSRARSSGTTPQRGSSTGSRARGTESSGSSSERKQKDDGGRPQPGLSSARTPQSALPTRPSRIAPERSRPSAATAPRSTTPRSSAATAPRSTTPRSSAATAPRSTTPRSSAATAPRSTEPRRAGSSVAPQSRATRPNPAVRPSQSVTPGSRRTGATAPRASSAGRSSAPKAAPASPRPSTPRAAAPRTPSRPAKAAPSSSKRDSGSAPKSAPAGRGGERRKR